MTRRNPPNDAFPAWAEHRNTTEVAPLLAGLRIPLGKGIAGEAAASERTINIADAYDDARFNPSFDKKTGFRTRLTFLFPLSPPVSLCPWL